MSYLSEIQMHAQCIDAQVERVLKDFLINYPQFEYWSGSHNKMLHHYGEGGLIRHTCEVIELGLASRRLLRKYKEVDDAAYFFAALFHDTGKMFDYKQVFPNEWAPTPHRRLIHHLPRSAIIWHDAIIKYPDLNIKYHDEVLHAILSHHGRRDAGSPVAPKSYVAWLLHLCDGISARMDDACTLDVVHPHPSV